MGRIYSAIVRTAGASALQDLWEVNAPATAIVILHSVRLGQTTDFADAEAEVLPVQISLTTNAVAGSGGTTPTAAPHEVGSTAFGGSVEANNTTQTTVTTERISDAWNIQAGWLYQPTPEERIIMSPSAAWVVELPAAPSDGITMEGTITIEEIGT